VQKKIKVCYLFTRFDNVQTLLNFIKNYKKYNSNQEHDLIICFKLLDVFFINNLKIYLNGINYIEFMTYQKKMILTLEAIKGFLKSILMI